MAELSSSSFFELRFFVLPISYVVLGYFLANYEFKKDIGEGNFGKVKVGIYIPTGEKFALKIIEKSKLKDDQSHQKMYFMNECINILIEKEK